METLFDVLIIGAGSIGLPTALFCVENGLKVAVIDKNHSAGQGDNKSAIGGIRATHAEPAKIILGKNSLDFFQNWEKNYKTSIGWKKGGYLYPVFETNHEEMLKKNLIIQHQYNLNIDWISPHDIKDIVPQIEERNLLGGTWSPDDGSASPIMTAQALYLEGLKKGIKYFFNEKIESIDKISEIFYIKSTSKSIFKSKWIINAAGVGISEIANLFNTEIKLVPDSHEAGITEPVKTFLKPMIVDIRKDKGSSNYYFYQNHEGQIEFCITPDPPIIGENRDSTSEFLPMVAKRMLKLMPILSILRVRRVWRGIYPNSLDGSPIIGFDKNFSNVIHAGAMCGQGYMFGPAVGLLIVKMIKNELDNKDRFVLDRLSLNRDFSSHETLK
ncbi:FAD-binding oxidoreductase [bacterium]|nr:FAD-binding oxidoreductase [bacterium]